MPATTLLQHAQEALMLAVAVALPIVAVAAVVGLVVAALQAATQIHEPTIAHLPRLLAVVAAVVLFSPWIGRQIQAFAVEMFTLAGVR